MSKKFFFFLVKNAFSGNLILNTINFKIFSNHGDICSFKRKLDKISGEGYKPKGFIEIWEGVLVFHPAEVDQMSTSNSGDWIVKSKLFPFSGSAALRQLNSIHKNRP